MLFTPQPLLFYRSSRIMRRLIGLVRGERGRVRSQRIAVLALYVVMNLGLPIGDFDPRATASQTASTKACRCSSESRAAGRCCCSKPAAGVAKRGCCSTPAKAEIKSCCAKKKTIVDVASTTSTTDSKELAWTGGCPCGPVNSPMLLFCPQPRILTDPVSLDGQSICTARPLRTSDSPCGERARPFVPPPESSVV